MTPQADGTYAKLSDTGLYCNNSTADRIDQNTLYYEPDWALWSDAAEKARYFRLPPGTQIDTASMDLWKFPVGTKAWKEFSLDGIKLETRLLEKRADGTWFMMPFAWNVEQTEAFPVTTGAVDVLGTPHDIPTTAQCVSCHRGASDTLLGLAALQLARNRENDGDISLKQLAKQGKLTHPPETKIKLPGTKLQARSLGYLYANCSHCHRGANAPRGLNLWTSVNDVTAEATLSYTTAVNMPLTGWVGHGYDTRIVPGQAALSGLVARMNTRVPADQMPKIGTELVDADGVKLISRWIKKMVPREERFEAQDDTQWDNDSL